MLDNLFLLWYIITIKRKGLFFMTKRETLIQMYSKAIWSEFYMWESEYCCSQKEKEHEKKYRKVKN